MKKKSKKFHMVHYVEDCSAKIRTFRKLKDVTNFIDEFYDKYPDQENGDNWIECVVTGIAGSIFNFDPSIKVEIRHAKNIRA
jgi:hypothetical protein